MQSVLVEVRSGGSSWKVMKLARIDSAGFKYGRFYRPIRFQAVNQSGGGGMGALGGAAAGAVVGGEVGALVGGVVGAAGSKVNFIVDMATGERFICSVPASSWPFAYSLLEQQMQRLEAARQNETEPLGTLPSAGATAARRTNKPPSFAALALVILLGVVVVFNIVNNANTAASANGAGTETASTNAVKVPSGASQRRTSGALSTLAAACGGQLILGSLEVSETATCKWPLKVHSAAISCLGSADFPQVVLVANGVTYGLNGAALRSRPPIDPIWREDKKLAREGMPGTKMDIGPFVDAGLALCP